MARSVRRTLDCHDPTSRVSQRQWEDEEMKDIEFDEKGLIPAVIQDIDTGEVLMLGYMNEKALDLTLKEDDIWFYSRSRQEMWHKGETSGNFIKVKEVWKDCDNDTILVKAKPVGPVCHTGERSCFFQRLR
jgi:phosphoribosyl-AMP cyclohydrolase